MRRGRRIFLPEARVHDRTISGDDFSVAGSLKHISAVWMFGQNEQHMCSTWLVEEWLASIDLLLYEENWNTVHASEDFVMQERAHRISPRERVGLRSGPVFFLTRGFSYSVDRLTSAGAEWKLKPCGGANLECGT